MIDTGFIQDWNDKLNRWKNDPGVGETHPVPYGRFMIADVVMNKDIERCVMPGCGKETPYTIHTPIDERLHYIDGAGQLCENCHSLTYGGENGR